MKKIYEYFDDFDELKTSLFKIEREVMKRKDFLVFRIYKRRRKAEEWQYLGVTYIIPEIANQVVDKNTLFYKNAQNGFSLKIHETPSLVFYFRLIQILLINYLKRKIREAEYDNGLRLKKDK